jgi:hypothetical protein
MGEMRRIFRILTRLGWISSFLVLIVWFWSTQNSAMYMRDNWCVHLYGGLLRFEQSPLVRAAISNNNAQFALRNQPIRQHQSIADLIKNGPKPPPPPPILVKSFWSVWPIPSRTYGFQSWQWRWDSWERRFVIPFWLLLFAGVSTTALSWGLSRRGRRRGHCIECGYCLTGNSSGVCPECGTAVKLASR